MIGMPPRTTSHLLVNCIRNIDFLYNVHQRSKQKQKHRTGSGNSIVSGHAVQLSPENE